MSNIRKWMIMATLGLAAIVAAVVAFSAASRSGHQAASENAAGRAQSCPATVVSTAMPTAPPGDLRWQNIGPILVPTSVSAGPERDDSAVWECYAHSPMGAVIAAYDIYAGLAGPDWRAVAEHEAVPGPGQQAFITAGDSQTYQAPDPGQIAQAVGFEVLSYTPQQATIEALASAGDGYQADERTVAWTGSDWKMVLTPQGTTGPDTQLVTSAAGFIPWGSAGNG